MMNDKRKGLGRGLDSLLPSRPSPGPIAMPAPQFQPSQQEVSVDLIDPNPYQTRRQINEVSLAELTESIRASGVVQPVVLRPSANGSCQLVGGGVLGRASGPAKRPFPQWCGRSPTSRPWRSRSSKTSSART